MKGKRILEFLSSRKKKILKVFFFLCLLCPCYCAAERNVQVNSPIVSLDLNNVDVGQLLAEIKKQTFLRFVYNEDNVARIGNFDVHVKNKKALDVLKDVLATTSLECFLKDQVIYIVERETSQQERDDNKVIRGRVVDEHGNALPGVTVRIAGTMFGVSTDHSGSFKVTIPVDTASLVFSFVGMETVTVKIQALKAKEKRNPLRIVLKETKQNLDEVVVTGYSNISRQSFTGNARTVTSEELKKISPTNILKSLQVLDPSFRIKVNNEAGSDPNVLPEISIRGASGIGLTEFDTEDLSKTALQNNPSLPTFIMDGFEVSVNKVYNLDVNRVESITILKDAAATAIYGSRAANGVVVITTVAPKEGQIMLTYNYDMNLQVPDLRDYNIMDAAEKIRAEKAAGLFDRGIGYDQYYYEKLRLLEKGVNTDWMYQPLRNSVSHKHYLRLEGGVKDLRYGIDVNYLGNNGVMKGSERNVLGLSFDISYNTSKLVFKNSASFSGTKAEDSPYGAFSTYTTMNPYYTFVDDRGEVTKNIFTMEGKALANPIYEVTVGNYSTNKDKEFINNFMAYYYPTKKIHFRGNIALTYKTGANEMFYAPESGRYNGSNRSTYKGELTTTNTTSTTWDLGLFGYYNDMVNNHYINLVAGVNMKESQDESERIYLRDFPAGGFKDPQFARDIPSAPSTFEQKNRLLGAMFSLNYTYNNIYLLDATCRIDGNSSFGTESRYAPFWSGGIGINIHNYSCLKRLGWLTEFKLRASYGVTGKANFPARTARTVYSLIGNEVYPTGAGAGLSAMGNRNLKWEKTEITDVGFSLDIFENRLNVKGSYYFRKTVDLIADMGIPSSSGFVTYKENVGEVENRGYEIDARVKVIGNKNVLFYVSANMAANKNKLTNLSEALKAYNKKVEEKYQDLSWKMETKKPFLMYVDGASVSSIYAMRSLGIDPQTGKELFLYKDGSVGRDWIASENVSVGNTEPKLNGTLAANFWFKGLAIDAYFTYTLGGDAYNQTLQDKIENANLEDNVDRRVFEKRWKEPGDVCRFKSIKDWNIPTNATSRFVEEDNTLTLSSLAISYELPRKLLNKMHLTKLKFSFNMNDVFRVSSIKRERGLNYPFAQGYFFSMNLSL